MTTYHKIETLYVRDTDTFKISEPFQFRNKVYGSIDPWVWTEKIDGTNIRCIWEPGQDVEFAGKTDRAQLHGDLVSYMRKEITPSAFYNAFPDGPAKVVVYGEGYGAGIQKGAGYRPDKSLIVFDVCVWDQNGHGWWLDDDNMRDVCNKMALTPVPLFGTRSLQDATNMVRGGFETATPGNCQSEGLVGRPLDALFDKKGARVIVKLKTKDFA